MLDLTLPAHIAPSALMASSGGTCGGIVWLGCLLWIILSLGAGRELVRANQEYLRLYRIQVDPSLPGLEQLYRRSRGTPWRWWVETLSLSWRIRRGQRRPGATPALEAARQRVLFWRKLTIAVVFGGILFPLLICLLVGE